MERCTSSGVLTYTPGETSKTFTITINEDSADEVDETINLTLSNPGNCTLGIIYTATLTIADNDGPVVTFSSTPYVASEAAGTATITVSLSLASVQAVTVRYTTSNGTAIAGNDYIYATGTLTFMPGELVKTFVVQISNDVLDELDETVNLTLSYPTNASIGTPNPVALTIVDNDTPPTVQFSPPVYTLNENGGAITLTVILSTASGTTVTVDYATSDGTATSISDYTSASGTLTFAAGVTSATFSVSVADDGLNEVSETVIVTLSNPSHASLGASNPATVTIVDNDGPTVALSATTYSVGESDGQAIITVNLSLPPALTVTVNYATTNGTASSSSDYAATSGTLTFLPNETSKTFIIPITSDLTDEVNETVNIAISNPSNGTLGTPNTAVLTIQDDDDPPTVQFSTAAYSIGEGGSAIFTVNLSVASSLPVTVSYATSNGTGTASSDYTTKTGQITFAPGARSATFTVSTTNDSLDEADETVVVTLSNPTNSTLGSPSAATLTITDDDDPPAVQFGSATYSVDEKAGVATIAVTLSTGSSLTVTVTYATSNGTATAGADYTACSGTLTFMPGETSKTFTVAISDDGVSELSETVNLEISSPGNATLGSRRSAVLTISDYVPPPTVHFSDATYNVNESAGTATITVTLSSVAAVSVTVDYATSNGTATAGSDYTTKTGKLTFAAGATSTTFTITIANDTSDEADETILLSLSNASNATLGTPSSATLTILDNDPPPSVQFSTATSSVSEKNGTATITVILNVAPSQSVMVTYSTSNGTAAAGTDYTSTSGTLTFDPGVKSKTFTVAIINDTLDEADETVLLVLSSPVNAAIGVNASATLTITDDDQSPTVQFEATTYALAENAGSAIVVVNLSAASGQTVSVNYSIAASSVKIGASVSAGSGTITFEPGETSKALVLPIPWDNVREGDETVKLTLTSPVKATLGTIKSTTLTIADVPWPIKQYLPMLVSRRFYF